MNWRSEMELKLIKFFSRKKDLSTQNFEKEFRDFQKIMMEKLELLNETISETSIENQQMIADTQLTLRETKEIIKNFKEQKENYIILESEEVANKIIDELCENTNFLERLTNIINANN